MLRCRTLMSVAVLAVSCAAGLHAQDKDLAWAISQAPANSFVVAGAQNLQGLWNSLKDLTGQGQKMPDVLAMAEQSFPVAIDAKGAAVVVLMPGGKRVVVMARLKAGATLTGEKLAGGITKITVAQRPDIYALQMTSWIAMSDNLEAIKTLAAASARLAVTAQQKADVNGRSLWVWVNTKALADELKTALAKGQNPTAAPAKGPDPVKMGEWAAGLLSQMNSLTASFDIKPQAASLTFGMDCVPDSQLALLSASGMPISSFKTGLPATSQLLFAGWGRVDWIKAVGPTKAMFKTLFDGMIPASNVSAHQSVDELWAVYGEWAATLGNEVGFVMETAPAGEGVFRVTETIALKNPDTFRKLISKTMPLSANLTKAVSGMNPMLGAAAAMEMKSDFKPAAETIEGVSVDINTIKAAFNTSTTMSTDDQEAAKKMMDSIYGPEGMTTRMAVMGQTAVMSVGGKKAMAGAIKAAKGQDPDLAADPKVAAALARVPKNAAFAGLISLPNYARMTISTMERAMMAMSGAQATPPAATAEPVLGDLVTFSVRSQGTTQLLDLYVPQSEIRGMIEIFEQMASKMGAGHQPAPQESAPADDDAAPKGE